MDRRAAGRGAALGILLTVVAVAVAVAAAPAKPAPPKPSADLLGLSVPRGSKVVAPQVWQSRLGFRKTVKFYERLWKRLGLEPEAVPVYRYRGVDVARFLAKHPDSPWQAVQIFRKRGNTRIAIVAAVRP